ncbi:hypothetical protein PtA15_9A275 [Puccinia triticina]|uniref:Uncharacterized protein n=1 Tax=Puccinia triticina TaxID=208348 RepID=A0ABY7CT23_9BASI|nr:uncharacterized protein PtA15_9A275 [Puccinia triticina]WAQ88150.1 hypothetical protein PtA15_9A275 [Puccinia triticina]
MSDQMNTYPSNSPCEANGGTRHVENGMRSPRIIDLRGSDSSNSSTELSLHREIVEGLNRRTLLVPGPAPDDRSFAYSKVIPTDDNLGLDIYDQITAVEDYYPFATELAILRAKGHEIACRLGGMPTSSTPNRGESPVTKDSDQRKLINQVHVDGFAHPELADYEDFSSSPANATGFSLTTIELGAGSLKKTSHLLENVARLLRARGADQTVPHLSQAEYYALDLEMEQLNSTLSAIQLQEDSGVGPEVGNQVQGHGICGTYTQGLDWIYKSLTTTSHAKTAELGKTECRKAILWLGSSIGNFSPAEAVEFLRDELGRALDRDSRALIGIDNCQLAEKVRLAYDDRQGVTKKFILNAVAVVARHLGLPESVLSPKDFNYVSRYNVGMNRNEAYLRAKRDISFKVAPVDGIGSKVQATSTRIKAGELILIERSYKFSPDDAYRLFDQAGLRVIQKWSDSPDQVAPTHTLYLIERAAFHFVRTPPWASTEDHPLSSAELPVIQKEDSSGWQSLRQIWAKNSKHSLPVRISDTHQLTPASKPPNPQGGNVSIGSEPSKGEFGPTNSGGLPSMSDWITLWKAWDTVTIGMIPKDMLHQKPIDLRHACLFYLGHIPVFADIHLSRYFDAATTEPHWFAQIFERGIDPNLEDPSKCNEHSPFPDQESEWPSLEEVLRFRDKLRTRLTGVYDGLGKEPGRKIRLTRKLGRVLSMIYEHEAMHLETLLYMLQQTHFVNHPPEFTPPDWDSLAREWDSAVEVEAQSREAGLIEYSTLQILTVGHDDLEQDDSSKPFSEVHEYGWDNESPSRKVEVKPFKLEATTITNQEYLEFVLQGLSDSEPIPHHAIPESWGYIFDSSDQESKRHQVKIKTIYGRIHFNFAKHWPVQASGSQLESFAKWKGGRLPTADELRLYLFDNPISLSAQNPIGFLNWHPLPPQRPRKGIDGRWRGGWNGGVWEWTSTTFGPHPNFKPSELYPGYSKDFFDGEHNILLGGSWATIPRIAHRQSFVNWYQFKYPYVFAGGRVAYDY